MNLLKRQFGSTGLSVSILGYGAGMLGAESLSDKEAEVLINQVLDLGITFIDTARGYGSSEERIGKFISHRRKEYVLSTKVGYGIPGYQDWTYSCITAGIDTALEKMKTDYLDIAHLHSCPMETLQQGEVIESLEKAKQTGKIKVAAYSGENEALAYAISTNRFGSIQTSINLCDQRGIEQYLPMTRDRNMGVIAKRPVANAPWRFSERPVGNYAEEYWHRWKTMNIQPNGIDWQELAIRFTAFQPGVHTCIVGTTNIHHLKQNVEAVKKGSLPDELMEHIRNAFQPHIHNWLGQI